jgi:hypothetical protein
MNRRHLTPEKIAEIQRLRRTTDLTNVEIAAATGVGVKAVSRHAVKVPPAERSPLAAKPCVELAPEQREKLFERIQNTTDSYQAIGLDFGISGVTVARYAAMLPKGSYVTRISNLERRVPDDVIDRIVELAIEGLTSAQIAAAVGRHDKTVQSVIRRRRAEIKSGRAEAAALLPVIVIDPVDAFADRLAAEGWDAAFISAAVRNLPRLAVSAQVAA